MNAFDPESMVTPAVRTSWRRDVLRADPSAAASLSWVFEAGLPDPATYPAADLSRIAADVLREDSGDALSYGDFRTLLFGHRGLRELMAERTLQRDGKEVDISSIMITAGAMHALQLAREAFIEPGDVYGMEQPTYGDSGAGDTIFIPLDGDGMRVDILESELQRLKGEGKRLKLLNTINDWHSPTGTCLSLPRRRRLLELASEYDFLIFQDAIYGEYRYEGEPIPSLVSLDEEGRVIRADSFSKIIAPAMRVCSVTGSPAVIEAMALARADMGTSVWLTRIVEQYLREGLLEPHLDSVRACYRQKRDVVVRALEEYCFPWVTFDKPKGGFFVWAKMSEEVDAGLAAMNAFAEGVAVRPGERFFDDKAAGKSYFRIAFSYEPIEKLEPGIATLGKAISASLRSA
jgi:2-aminoadipate transaminase